MECSYKNRSHWKNISKEKSQTCFCCLCVNLPTVTIWGQSDKFPMSFSFLQSPLQVKKLFRENSAKYVNQTGNFYFRLKLKTAISLPIFNLFQWFLFYIRDFIWIVTLTNRNLKKIVDLKVFCILKLASLQVPGLVSDPSGWYPLFLYPFVWCFSGCFFNSCCVLCVKALVPHAKRMT